MNSWLSTVFGDQPVPHFEVNTRTVDILYQLAQSSEARCSDTALLIEDHKQKASEYEAEGGYLSQIAELNAVKYGLPVVFDSKSVLVFKQTKCQTVGTTSNAYRKRYMCLLQLDSLYS